MDPADRLLRLFNYDMWANEQVVQVLKDNLDFEDADKVVEYFVHIAGAQDLWYKRIKDQPLEDLKVWPDYGLPVALQKLKTLSEKWQNLIIANRSDLDRIIFYKNSKGRPFETMLSDILHHVVIHGQHHRAQIAKLLRNAKIDPPGTDFIFFCRAN